MLRCAQHDENQDCMTFCRHPEPFKGEGSSEVLVTKNNWMLRLRLSMTRVEPSRFVFDPLGQKQKDFRWSTTGSPRDGIGCSFKLSNFF